MIVYILSAIGIIATIYLRHRMILSWKAESELRVFGIDSKSHGNDSIIIAVKSENDITYRWQELSLNSMEWNDIDEYASGNTYIIDNVNKVAGYKYRCLIEKKDIVIGYSRAYVVPFEPDTKSDYTYNDYSYSYHSEDKSYQKSAYDSIYDTDSMDGAEFEHFCAKVLGGNGFTDVDVTKASGDYGIDILAKKEGITYAVQCKCYSSTVGNKAVQEAISGKSFYNTMVAAVLTNNYFTEAAKETAKRTSVLLWDRDYLSRLIDNYNNKDTEQESNNYEETKELDLFKGCTTWEQVKERYRSLLKTYHPDNVSGDEEYTRMIQRQYENLKARYGE